MAKLRGAKLAEKKALNRVEWLKDKVAEITVILMICALPLYFNEQRYIGLTGHKYRFFLVCMGVVLCAVLVVYILKIAGRLVKLPQSRPTITDIALLGFVIVTFLSALLSSFHGAFFPYTGDIGNVWDGLYERHDGFYSQALYAVIFFIVAYWYKPRLRDFSFFGISAGLIGLIGIMQFYGFDLFNLYTNVNVPGTPYFAENLYDSHVYFRTTLGNVNIVSTYTCVALLLCGFLFVRINDDTKKWYRPIWLAGSALCFWMMLIAKSESGMAGVLAATVLALPFIVDSRKHLGNFLLLASSWAGVFTLQRLFFNTLILETETMSRIALYFGVTFLLLAGGLALTVFWRFIKKAPKEVKTEQPQKVKWKLGVILTLAVIASGFIGVEVIGSRIEPPTANPVYEAREILHGRIKDSFGSGRIYIWRRGLEIVKDYPLIGSGPDTFAFSFPDQAEALELYKVPYDKAHNDYIQILACQGILGILFYLVFLGSLFGKSFKNAFKNPLIAVVLIAFIGFCVQAFFNINIPITTPILWVLAGMLACLVRMEKQKNNQEA